MDRLNDEERALAWKASWHPSFSGVAIVNKDFTFRSANPQFCKLLGVTPADLIGHRFQDITPPNIRELDEKNAQMVIDGYIDFYLLPKSYEFARGERVDVVLLVTRAPLSSEGDFQFFVSRIMLDEGGGLLSAHTEKELHSPAFYQKWTVSVVDFLMKYWVWIVMIAATSTGAVIEVLGRL